MQTSSTVLDSCSFALGVGQSQPAAGQIRLNQPKPVRATSDRTYTSIATKTFEYTYYPDGSRETMVNPAGTWTYYYDANGRPTSMSSPAGTVSYQYLDNGWLSKRTLPNGAYTDYGYNAVGALTSLANKKSGGTNLSTYGTFSYDGVFNLTGVTASNIATSNQNGATSWTYDTKDRMTFEGSARLGGYTQSFGYDNSGNPTTWKGSTYSFNSNNQRSATGFTFDGNGNPTTYASTSMTYDVENRLTGIGSSWTAGYRADGLRAWKDNGTTRTYFLYDGGLPVVEMNSSGTTTAYSVYGPDGLVARNQNSTTFQYVFDQQGNIAQRLDGSGNVITSSVYDAYGVENSSGSPVDPFGYNAQWGYYLDRETGLYACMFRYFDPGQGRWLNRDPIGYAGGVNVYGYCGGGPVGNVDQTGLTWYYVYFLFDAQGNYRKTGFSKNPRARYYPKQLAGGNVDPAYKSQNKEASLGLENAFNRQMPGPANHMQAQGQNQAESYRT